MQDRQLAPRADNQDSLGKGWARAWPGSRAPTPGTLIGRGRRSRRLRLSAMASGVGAARYHSLSLDPVGLNRSLYDFIFDSYEIPRKRPEDASDDRGRGRCRRLVKQIRAARPPHAGGFAH